MTEIEYTRNYRTQAELRAAYRRLGHTRPDVSIWSATLLVDHNLRMSWACPVLAPELAADENPAPVGWRVIAEAGELDWPPLRDEADIWPALLARHPVPTGDEAEKIARVWGQNIEEAHYAHLRRHYLGDAHSHGMKLNARDVNFDPDVRDWDVTARQLADFIDTHRPPKLTTAQRVMKQGVNLSRQEAQVAETKTSLARLMRNDQREQAAKARRDHTKTDLALWAGVTRRTADAWLADTTTGEGPVPDTEHHPAQLAGQELLSAVHDRDTYDVSLYPEGEAPVEGEQYTGLSLRDLLNRFERERWIAHGTVDHFKAQRDGDRDRGAQVYELRRVHDGVSSHG